MQKYELTDESKRFKNLNGKTFTVYRVRALKSFWITAIKGGRNRRIHIQAGALGGWIESPDNLTQIGSAWVDENAVVLDKAKVSGDAWVGGEAVIMDSAQVYDAAKITDNARISGSSKIYDGTSLTGDCCITDNAEIYGYSKLKSAKIGKGIKIHNNTVI